MKNLPFEFIKTRLKELCLCHKLNFWNLSVLATQNRRHEVFKIMINSDNLSFKYEKFTPLDCKQIGIRKFEVVAKTKFL